MYVWIQKNTNLGGKNQYKNQISNKKRIRLHESP